MKYKALMLDLDGTTIPNRKDGMPSKKVTAAIAEASKQLHVGIATSRTRQMAEHIVKHLNLSGPSIIHGGALIVDINKEKIYRTHYFQPETIQGIYNTAKKYGVSLIVDTTDGSWVMKDESRLGNNLIGSVIKGFSPEIAEQFITDISELPDISIHKITSWTKGMIDLSIGTASATKQHGILEVVQILKITPEEIIGVGDEYNDFPLLMACGLKVAMGNAVPELKAIADYIAPSVEDDGVADVIEKFILSK